MSRILLNRVNRVAHFQRMFQEGEKNGVRQWNQTPKSKVLLYPYYAVLFGSFGASMYAMGRMVLGHRSWFGKD